MEIIFTNKELKIGQYLKNSIKVFNIEKNKQEIINFLGLFQLDIDTTFGYSNTEFEKNKEIQKLINLKIYKVENNKISQKIFLIELLNLVKDMLFLNKKLNSFFCVYLYNIFEKSIKINTQELQIIENYLIIQEDNILIENFIIYLKNIKSEYVFSNIIEHYINTKSSYTVVKFIKLNKNFSQKNKKVLYNLLKSQNNINLLFEFLNENNEFINKEDIKTLENYCLDNWRKTKQLDYLKKLLNIWKNINKKNPCEIQEILFKDFDANIPSSIINFIYFLNQFEDYNYCNELTKNIISKLNIEDLHFCIQYIKDESLQYEIINKMIKLSDKNNCRFLYFLIICSNIKKYNKEILLQKLFELDTSYEYYPRLLDYSDDTLKILTLKQLIKQNICSKVKEYFIKYPKFYYSFKEEKIYQDNIDKFSDIETLYME